MTFDFRHRVFKVATYAIPPGLLVCWGLSEFGWLPWEPSVPFIGVLLSFVFFAQRQRLKEIALFEDLFTSFNQRYDAMNGKLNAIREGEGLLRSSERQLLYDYFNLCAEQYLFYQDGYIPEKVWKAWTNGMKTYYEDNRIGALWSDELKNPSYYDFPEEVLKEA